MGFEGFKKFFKIGTATTVATLLSVNLDAQPGAPTIPQQDSDPTKIERFEQKSIDTQEVFEFLKPRLENNQLPRPGETLEDAFRRVALEKKDIYGKIEQITQEIKDAKKNREIDEEQKESEDQIKADDDLIQKLENELEKYLNELMKANDGTYTKLANGTYEKLS